MERKISAILVDDEKDSLDAIYEQLKLYCPSLDIVGCFDDSLKGLEAIQHTEPDLVFLDIDMPKLNGLELAQKISSLKTHIIFVTAYSQYAIDAIKLSALDYLLKPIEDVEELQAAIEKARIRIHGNESSNQGKLPVLNQLIENSNNQNYSQKTKIGLADDEGILYVKIEDIIRLEAQRNYCQFYFIDGSKKLVAKNMGYYIDSLIKYSLVQVHRAHVVNLEYVKKYVRKNGPYLRMIDDSEVPVSNHYLDNYEFLT